jgi:hypothetical protein
MGCMVIAETYSMHSLAQRCSDDFPIEDACIVCPFIVVVAGFSAKYCHGKDQIGSESNGTSMPCPKGLTRV